MSTRRRASDSAVVVDGRRLALGNLDKVLYPAAGFTKADVIDYYARVAPVLLPHLKGRHLTLKRYPDGVEGEYFYEKRCPGHRPAWVRTRRVPSESGPIEHCLVEDRATLVWLANLADLELHTPMALARAPDRPTMIVFDLDPGAPAGLVECCRVAEHLAGLLADLGLAAYPKTSGGKGLQVYLPLNTPASYEDTTAFSRLVARWLEARLPDQVVSTQVKARRMGKVLVDWMQNVRSKTTVCAYSLRAGAEPTVSTPVTWAEVEACARTGRAMTFGPAEVLARVAAQGDLFEPVLTRRQTLPRPPAPSASRRRATSAKGPRGSSAR